MILGKCIYLFVNAFTQISGLRAWSGRVPKLRQWTYRSVHTLSQHVYVVRWEKKLEVNWATDPQMVWPPRRFEAFSNLLAVSAAVQPHICVRASKTYGEIPG